MRSNETDYIESLRLMIHLEEAAEVADIEKCNQTDVKLHHLDDNEFYFFVEVMEHSHSLISIITTHSLFQFKI